MNQTYINHIVCATPRTCQDSMGKSKYSSGNGGVLGSSPNVTAIRPIKLPKVADLRYGTGDSHRMVNGSEITVTPLFPVERSLIFHGARKLCSVLTTVIQTMSFIQEPTHYLTRDFISLTTTTHQETCISTGSAGVPGILRFRDLRLSSSNYSRFFCCN